MATGQEKLYISQNGGGKATITAQEVADLAPGGGGSLADLSDVLLGGSFPLSAGDTLYISGDPDAATFINIPMSAIVNALIFNYLSSLPGYAANSTLMTNGDGDFVWTPNA